MLSRRAKRLIWLWFALWFALCSAMRPLPAVAQPVPQPGAQPAPTPPAPAPSGEGGDEGGQGAPAAAPSAPAPGALAPGPQGTGAQGPAAGDAPEFTDTLPPTEGEQARGQPVAKVVIAGNRRISTEDISAYLGQIRVGRPFTPEGLSRDVRELWDSGLFEDVEIDLTRRDEGVHLRLLVRERPSIKAIEYKGNSEVDEEDLTEALSAEVKTGTILSYAAIRRGVQKIRDKYAEEGYFLAEVEFEVVPQKDNQVTLRFTIKEHEPVTVRRITFIGNNNVPDAELREVMLTGQDSLFNFGTGGPFRQDAFERDVLVLNALYYDRGFLSAQIATPRVMLTPDRTGIEVTVAINEGPRYRIRSLRIQERDADGREIEPLGGRRRLREMVRAKQGDWFNRAELAKDLAAVQTLYRDEGYANVEAVPDTQLDPEQREVDISVTVRRNQLVYFGRIEIRGNTKTRDKVIRREMEIYETGLFSETKLERSKRRITALGYFERVDISTEQGDDPSHVNVFVEIGEKPTGTFQIGAGFSSIENFIATAQVQQANLFGNGQSLAIQAQISGLRQLVDVRFIEPYLFDSRFSGSINVYDQLRIYDQFSQTSMGGSLTLGYPIIEPQLRASLAYTLESNEISTSTTSTFLGTASAVSVFQRLPLANLFNDGVTSSIRPALTYDTRNNQLFPTAGIYLQGSVELASKYLGSDNQFWRYRTTARFYYPITDSIVIKLNSEAGLVTSPDPTGVPIFARFFLGGIFDVRGFYLRSIGPRLPLRATLDENSPPISNGANIGGNLMYYQNLEFEFPIIDAVQIRGVVFTDLGNAWNLEQLYCNAAPASPYDASNPCFTFSRLLNVRTSWGFGIRWFSPLGPLRFEWGFPFAPLPYEESNRFEFTIGNFF
ncbi:outer membrane protein assembly factor BamA [Chondromyces apiculatus]|uniref:Outer membrane protein assembly factor BamA n=1 Tax=Chondromyces apiculatus DSM 436 TaxID=1192034 RepID=A0A017T8X1_9BACT|nr:outer membrane protein assembly factor BamA [Chondromyces apiculatus]EYF05265.1 Outer membrane protein assembly factor YaeT precursor [Chondromyces apiculatus DSM 436]